MIFTNKQELMLKAISRECGRHIDTLTEQVRLQACSASPAAYTKIESFKQERDILLRRKDFVDSLIDLQDYWKSMLTSVPAAPDFRKLREAGVPLMETRELLTITDNNAIEALKLLE